MERPAKPRKLRPGDRLAAITLSWGGPGRRFAENASAASTEPYRLSLPSLMRNTPRAEAARGGRRVPVWRADVESGLAIDAVIEHHVVIEDEASGEGFAE